MPINENAVFVDATGVPQRTPAHRQAVNDAFTRGDTVLVRRRNARSFAAWEIATNLDLPDTIAEYFVPDAQQAARLRQAAAAAPLDEAALAALVVAAAPRDAGALDEVVLAAHGFSWHSELRVYTGVLGPWRAQLYQRASSWYLEVDGPRAVGSSSTRVTRPIADAADLVRTAEVLGAFAAPVRTGPTPRGGI
jgi:hypothetical protein